MRPGLRTLPALLTAAALAAAFPAPAAAQSGDLPADLSTETSQAGSTNPAATKSKEGGTEGLTLSADEAIHIARDDINVLEAEQAHPGKLDAVAQAKPPDTWQVGFQAGKDEVVQVLVDDATGKVRESWTGNQVEWQMARGYEGSFGHTLNAPYVWIPLCLIFLICLLDFRQLRRAAHLDLAVLLAFSISQIYFNRGEIGVSVPLVYPVLAYLFARAVWIGFRGSGRGLTPTLSAEWLAIGAIFLIAFRVAINIVDSGVIDVGYAGVIGADHLLSGEAMWGEKTFPDDNGFGDTYGPVNYLFYVPFELAMPWSGEWDQLPAAHAASIFFDLATVAGLFVLGRRLREGQAGLSLGVVLAFAWLAYPYSDYALQSNSNDSLVAALLVWALVFFARPAARGLLLAAATLTKFVPLVLAPLFAVGTRGLAAGRSLDSDWLRKFAIFSVSLAAAAAVFLLWPLLDTGLDTFYDRTVASQIDRTSPFSLWGQTDLGWLQTAIRIATVGLGILFAFFPRERTIPQVAALAAALLIAVQFTADHWFYLYIVWFFPLLLVGIATARESEPARTTPPARPLEPQPQHP